MIQRRAKAAKVKAIIGNRTFWSPSLPHTLKSGGKRETAQQIANHESPRTTNLYGRREEEISLDEVEGIAI